MRMGLARSKSKGLRRWNERKLMVVEKERRFNVFTDSKGCLSLEPGIFLVYLERTLAL